MLHGAIDREITKIDAKWEVPHRHRAREVAIVAAFRRALAHAIMNIDEPPDPPEPALPWWKIWLTP